MFVKPEIKSRLLKPGTIWKRKVNGSWQRVYLESTYSRLVQNSSSSVDFRTEFGTEHMPRTKFLSLFEFLGWASVRLNEIADDKNLIPTIGDPKEWKKE